MRDSGNAVEQINRLKADLAESEEKRMRCVDKLGEIYQLLGPDERGDEVEVARRARARLRVVEADLSYMKAHSDRDALAYRAMEIRVSAMWVACWETEGHLDLWNRRDDDPYRQMLCDALSIRHQSDAEVLAKAGEQDSPDRVGG